MKLVVQPEAEADIVGAAVWYDAQAQVVRQRFLQRVETSLAAIERQPHRYQKVFGQVRRVMLRGFPYALLYVASQDEVNVLACFHTSRDPQRWQNRIPE